MKAECETKCKLLRVALELIWESSYGSVSVDDICKRAEVKKGSFYYFFPSKSDLAVAALEADWQKKQAELDQTFSAQVPPLERIERYCSSCETSQVSKQQSCGKVCGCPTLTLGSELSTQDENIRKKAAEIMERYIRYFESAIRDAMAEGLVSGENARALAEQLFAFSQGLLLYAKVRNDLQSLNLMKDGMLRLLQLQAEPAR